MSELKAEARFSLGMLKIEGPGYFHNFDMPDRMETHYAIAGSERIVETVDREHFYALSRHAPVDFVGPFKSREDAQLILDKIE